MKRQTILDEAARCVCQDRESQYGPPENNFQTIANLWSDYWLGKGLGIDIKPVDVGLMMALVKVGRIASGMTKDDNFVDLAGYAACAGELARTD